MIMSDTHFTRQTDPIALFTTWMHDAKTRAEITEPTAMSLATADSAGKPSVRMVLLKTFGAEGFTFFTNFESRKSAELKQNPHAALCFYWMALERQVRVEGRVERASDAEADAYYNSRMLISRIGAWASDQSRPLDAKATLEKRVKEMTEKFGDSPPRPPHWSGWRVVPERIEFWQQGDFRLHDRVLFTKEENGWARQLLYP